MILEQIISHCNAVVFYTFIYEFIRRDLNMTRMHSELRSDYGLFIGAVLPGCKQVVSSHAVLLLQFKIIHMKQRR